MLLSLRRIGPTWPLLYVLCYCLGVIAFFVAARYRVHGAAGAHGLCRLRGVGAVGLGDGRAIGAAWGLG